MGYDRMRIPLRGKGHSAKPPFYEKHITTDANVKVPNSRVFQSIASEKKLPDLRRECKDKYSHRRRIFHTINNYPGIRL